VSPDPIYENLYDRFYAIMADLAITEHLSFAYALSGDAKYGQTARQCVLASCRAWQREADGEPDSGKAYAVSRLLKGIAVGYDLAFDRFSDAEIKEIRETLTRIAKLYFEKYFNTPTISGPGFRTHHAIVEWSSFGVVALALRGEAPEAEQWINATVQKFEKDLLPNGLASDGAQVEGATFWASTMHYRIFFMDALRHVTGRDLFKTFAHEMNADLALASIASEHFPGYSQNNENTVLEPYYGQIDYYSPVLTLLAREYRRPIYQYLAGWDHSLGKLQKTRATTPHGEQLLFELGGYAYVWYDPTVPAKISDAKLSYHFPSVDQAYLRCSWKPNDLLVGVSKGQLVIHAGGKPVLIELDPRDPPADLPIQSVTDDGSLAAIRCGNSTNQIEIEMDRAADHLRVLKSTSNEWQWYCHGNPISDGNVLKWNNRVTMRIRRGQILKVEPEAYAPLFATGFNKLKMVDPAPMKFTLVTLKPDQQGKLELEVGR